MIVINQSSSQLCLSCLFCRFHRKVESGSIVSGSAKRDRCGGASDADGDETGALDQTRDQRAVVKREILLMHKSARLVFLLPFWVFAARNPEPVAVGSPFHVLPLCCFDKIPLNNRINDGRNFSLASCSRLTD